jgi:hypothetical protein
MIKDFAKGLLDGEYRQQDIIPIFVRFVGKLRPIKYFVNFTKKRGICYLIVKPCF